MLLELREIPAADSRFLAMLSTFIQAFNNGVVGHVG
jgi:hypothetical protein